MRMAMTRAAIGAAMLFGAVAACAQEPAWVNDARKVAGSVPPRLLAVLAEEIGKGGPEAAILVCRDKALGYRPGEIRGAMTIRRPV